MQFNTFTILAAGFLYALTALCFLLPFKAGKKSVAWTTLCTLLILVTTTVLIDLSFLSGLIWLIMLAFQIIFLSYWTLRLVKRPKFAILSASVLTCIFAYLALSPWISDWTFSKSDAKSILLGHKIKIENDFKILENSAGGIRDYYHTFQLKLSGADFDRVDKTFRTSVNFSGMYRNLLQHPEADYKKFDTVDFETPYHIEREYWSRHQMSDGTFHFRIQLGKRDSVLNYIGSDE